MLHATIPDRMDGMYQRMMMECTADGTFIVQDRDGNVVGARSGVKPVAFNHETQSPEMVETYKKEKYTRRIKVGRWRDSVNHEEDRNIIRCKSLLRPTIFIIFLIGMMSSAQR